MTANRPLLNKYNGEARKMCETVKEWNSGYGKSVLA
jgi:hypothetical protein